MQMHSLRAADHSARLLHIHKCKIILWEEPLVNLHCLFIESYQNPEFCGYFTSNHTLQMNEKL